ncbi:MAG: two-component regulator propeller domain-containing protein, partial [Verrucomicrobiota bacterium]
GGLWLANSDRLQKLENGRLTTIPNHPWKPTAPGIREMYEDHSGALWIGTILEGLYRYADGVFTRVGTSHQRINSITEDHEGNIWVTTEGGGLNRLRPKIFRVFDSKAGLVEDISDSICGDNAGHLWLANRSGGLVRLRHGREIEVFRPEGGFKSNVNLACADDEGNLWLGAVGLWRFHPETLQTTNVLNTSARIRALFKDSRGRVWVGGDDRLLGHVSGGKFRAISQKDGYTSRRARSLSEGPEGMIWVGTEDGDLYQINDEGVTRFTVKDGLPGVPLREVQAARDGSVWIASIRGGLSLYKNGRFHRFSVADGLPNDEISQLIEDDHGLLWCGSARGIFYVPKRELLARARGTLPRVNAIVFGRSEGLAGGYSLDNFDPSAWKTSDGRLWFATRQGVVSINPAAMRSNPHPPPVDIPEVLIQDQPVPVSGPIEAPPGRKKIEFRFAALSFAAPEKVRVRYQLEGVDRDWMETGAERNAIYAGLEPGHYRLRVAAANNDGVWNESGATLAFTVLPAWWQTLWFRAGLLVCFAGTVAASARYWSHRRLKRRLERLSQEQALEAERKRIARDLHDDVGASIAQIGLALEELKEHPASPDELKSQSAQLSARVRTLARDLDAVVWTVNPRNDSLPELAAYLGQCFLEALRTTPIRPRLEVADDIPDHPLSPEMRHHLFLTAREAMNNLLKHSNATEATLTLSAVDGSFELKIEDNGRGFSPEATGESTRNGLRNMKSRIAEIGGEFHLTSAPGKGTLVAVRIPLVRTAKVHLEHN